MSYSRINVQKEFIYMKQNVSSIPTQFAKRFDQDIYYPEICLILCHQILFLYTLLADFITVLLHYSINVLPTTWYMPNLQVCCFSVNKFFSKYHAKSVFDKLGCRGIIFLSYFIIIIKLYWPPSLFYKETYIYAIFINIKSSFWLYLKNLKNLQDMCKIHRIITRAKIHIIIPSWVLLEFTLDWDRERWGWMIAIN